MLWYRPDPKNTGTTTTLGTAPTFFLTKFMELRRVGFFFAVLRRLINRHARALGQAEKTRVTTFEKIYKEGAGGPGRYRCPSCGVEASRGGNIPPSECEEAGA